ncbi:MAG: N-acetylmuramoyl-L-alanine amidase [Clostridiales bacterium]|nr:N-acetylmuramoyl-L-alanine amidase [Clostridiales bacterium]
MVIRRKTIMLAAVLAAAGALAGVLIKETAVREVFSSDSFTVICDAGHGAPDSGAVGSSGTLEKDINLAIVEKLREVLEAKGVRVVLTREDDSGIYDDDAQTIREMKVSDMKKRLAIMKDSGAELFVSIHMNAFKNKKANGINVFYDSHHEEIKPLAENIQNAVCEVTGAQGHNIRSADEKLFLMKNPPIASILVECGFISNPEEEKKLTDEEYQARIAWAMAEAISEYAQNR